LDEGHEALMARRRASGVGLACALLLFGVAAGCSSDAEDPSPSGGAGEAAGGAEPAPVGSAGGGGAPEPNVGGAGGEPTAAVAGNAGESGAGGAAGAAAEIPETPAYASSVESFEAGTAAGFNQDKLPDIVLGPPQGHGSETGSLDVLSLGAGGEIVLGFGDLSIVDGPGPDLIVFENAFWPGGDASMVFAELGEVSVSEDGNTWHTFACDSAGDGQGHFKGCAGVTPTLAYDADTLVPLDPQQSGGDAFDLADLGLKRARFVKIRDLETQPPGGTTSGFDLDAVGAIHAL
jgi:hypothetical protein